MRKNRFLVLVFCFLYPSTWASPTTFGDISVELVSVYDGDTITVNIKGYPPIVGEKISVRVWGVDAPEMRSLDQTERAYAVEARKFVRKSLQRAKEIRLVRMRRDKYFRILAEVVFDGHDLGEELLKVGLGNRYYGGKKQMWSHSPNSGE
jgi:endonuclease YncB( thermonuclease family)